LSDKNTSAAQRLTHATVPYVLVDGTPIAMSWSGLGGALLHALNMTEAGATPVVQNQCNVFTNTREGGLTKDANQDCNAWQAGPYGIGPVWGHLNHSNWWTLSCSGGSCASSGRIYCFEQ
jgi:hypothetical protein